MIRAVVDTNVLVAAIRRGTTTRRVVEAWMADRMRPVVSRGIVREYLHVLSYPKLQLSPREVRQVIEEIVLPYAEVVEDVPLRAGPPAGVERDDVKFLACAVTAGVRYLITGDAALLGIGRFRSVEMADPARFLDLLD